MQRQYSGTAGRIENCQIGVFLGYASSQGRAFLDRELYLPQAWARDLARRGEAGVPPAVAFATKPELAQRMLERAFAAAVPAAWVTGDEIYGDDGDLRRWLEAGHHPYVLAVSAHHPVWQAGAQERADQLIAAVPPEAWAPLSAGTGSQGERLYDWACIQVPYESAPATGHWLLARRSLQRPDRVRLLPRVRARRHARRDHGARRRDALGDRGELRGRQRRGRARPLRGAQVDRLVSPRHPGAAGPCLPRSDPAPRHRRAKRGR